MDPRKRRADFWSITTWVLLAILAIFLVLPIGRLLKEAVYTDGHFSMDAFQKFFSKSYYYGTIGNSTKIGLSVMVCSLLLGVPFAYFYTFYTLGGRKILFVLCLLCTMSAPYIGAYAWILLMGNSGLVTQFLKTIGLKGISIYGFGGIVFVQTLKFFPPSATSTLRCSRQLRAWAAEASTASARSSWVLPCRRSWLRRCSCSCARSPISELRS